MAIGHQQRSLVSKSFGTGAARAIQLIDACCLAKAYVTAGIGQGVQASCETELCMLDSVPYYYFFS